MCLKPSVTIRQLLTYCDNLQVIGKDELTDSEVTRPRVIGLPIICRGRLCRAQHQFMSVD
jgi:hypothetical protein